VNNADNGTDLDMIEGRGTIRVGAPFYVDIYLYMIEGRGTPRVGAPHDMP